MGLKRIALKESLGSYSDLIRFKRPMGTILLFIPCTWGLILGAKGVPSLWSVFLFLTGAFLMRSAGCAYNDWVNQDFDGSVKRSATRPLVIGSLKQKHAWITIVILLASAFFVFLALPLASQAFALGALILVFIYPWMKRITKWPQVVLGLAYSMGIPMGYSYESTSPPWSLALVYGAAVLWTVFYDTIYAHQDLEDDLKIGLKSTTQVMAKYPKFFLNGVIGLSIALILTYSFYQEAPLLSYIIISLGSFLTFLKVARLDLKDPDLCLKAFKQSSLWGWALTISFLLQTTYQK